MIAAFLDPEIYSHMQTKPDEMNKAEKLIKTYSSKRSLSNNSIIPTPNSSFSQAKVTKPHVEGSLIRSVNTISSKPSTVTALPLTVTLTVSC